MDEERGDPRVELEALTKVAEALDGLNDAAVQRVLRWAADRFGASAAVADIKLSDGQREESGGDSEPDPGYEDIASFFTAASPTTDADRALVAGYWVQYMEGASEFEAFTINKHLKNLGHGVSNITDALDRLKARKPQLVIQTKKSGTSRQARKKYKLTNAGKLAVDGMLRGE